MENCTILSMSHFVILKRKQSSKLLNITQTWELKLLLGWDPGLAQEFWNSCKEISAGIDEERSALCSTFQSKNFYLFCINFRGNFLKYLLCVGVKSECSKRPQREDWTDVVSKATTRKVAIGQLLTVSYKKNLKPNHVQETWGIWFKSTQVKKFRHQDEAVLLSQAALTDDGCVVSAPESAEELGPALPSKMSQLQQSHLNTKHVPKSWDYFAGQ